MTKEQIKTINSLAVKASVDMTIDTYGVRNLNRVPAHLIASLFAAGAYSIRRIFSVTPDEELQAEQFRKILEQIKVEIEVQESGEHTTSVKQTVAPPPPPSPKKPEKKFSLTKCARKFKKWQFRRTRNALIRDYNKLVAPITVENKKGTTIYNIQNLNIYLNAEIVHQLNINPQQVINQLHEQIKEEINKIDKQDI